MKCSKCSNDTFFAEKGVRKCASCGFPVSDKHYLGDAVYYTYDGFGVMLTTEDGLHTISSIYLEPDVIAKLLKLLGTNYDRAKMRECIEDN